MTSQTVYLDAAAARDHIRSRGVKIGENALKDHRSRGTGPAWVLINGRALYTRSSCDEWIDNQAAQSAARLAAERANSPAPATAPSAPSDLKSQSVKRLRSARRKTTKRRTRSK